jgi:hypothetical protein
MTEQQQTLQQMMQDLDAMYPSMDEQQQLQTRRAMAALMRLQADLAPEEEQS